jgi:hypothetical protein
MRIFAGMTLGLSTFDTLFLFGFGSRRDRLSGMSRVLGFSVDLGIVFRLRMVLIERVLNLEKASGNRHRRDLISLSLFYKASRQAYLLLYFRMSIHLLD